MRNITVGITLAIFLLAAAGSGAELTEPSLQIHLLRDCTVAGDIPNLGQVAIIRGEELLAAKAGEVTLGRISMPGQKIVVDRSTVLSRLACSGIDVSKVEITGAEKISISRQHQIITGAEFVEKALAFLKTSPADASICQWNPTRTPKDLILPGSGDDIRLSASPVRIGVRNQAKVRIDAFSNDQQIAMREVTFRLKYNRRKLVARVDIASGEIITGKNVKVENGVSDYPEPANWAVPYGFVAKRQLPVNTVIQPNMIGPVKPKILLKRNQNVVIKVDRLGLFITAIGKAMQDGRAGEYIKVQNADSRRVIMAKINEDGSVEPVF